MLLLVSHDTIFLDTICTHIWELQTVSSGYLTCQLTVHAGNYTSFLQFQIEKYLHFQRICNEYLKEIEHLQEFIQREGKKYDNPSHQSQRKMKMKQVEKLQQDYQEWIISHNYPSNNNNNNSGGGGAMDHSNNNKGMILSLQFPKPFAHFSVNETMLLLKDVAFGWPIRTNNNNNNNNNNNEETSVGSPNNASSNNNNNNPKVEEFLLQNVQLNIRHKARIVILGNNNHHSHHSHHSHHYHM
jgi:ATPase subunit of ABC transporter with duplicated ATPase domains